MACTATPTQKLIGRWAGASDNDGKVPGFKVESPKARLEWGWVGVNPRLGKRVRAGSGELGRGQLAESTDHICGVCGPDVPTAES